MRDFVTKIVLLISISIAIICEAHPQSVYLRGAVRDAFTNMGVEKSHVSLIESDSAVVTSCVATVPIVTTRTGKSVQTRADFTQGAGFQLEVPQEGDYIVRVSMTGYEPEEKKYMWHGPVSLWIWVTYT